MCFLSRFLFHRSRGRPLATLLLFLLGGEADAQQVFVVPSEPICQGCNIEVSRVVILGSEHGEGYVDSPQDVSRVADSYVLVNRSVPHEIRVFDSSGAFQRVVGRFGRGPGEFLHIWDLDATAGGTLSVLDIGNQRLTLFGPNFEEMGSARLIGRPMMDGFVGLPGGGFILNAPYPDGKGGAALLHRLDAEGRRLFSFLRSEEASPRGFSNPEGSLRIPAVSPDGSRVYVAYRESMTVEEWSVDGELLATLAMSERSWEDFGFQPQTGYSPGIQHLRVDQNGFLWILIRVPDPSWEDAVEVVLHGNRRVQGISDYNKYWDSIVQIWSPKEKRILVMRRFQDYLHGFTENLATYSFRLEEAEGAAYVDLRELHLDLDPAFMLARKEK